MPEIIQGNWDDLVRSKDLRGRRVRLIVLDEEASEGTAAERIVEADQRIQRFRIWADSHEPLGHPIDDSRESIYPGSMDDPR